MGWRKALAPIPKKIALQDRLKNKTIVFLCTWIREPPSCCGNKQHILLTGNRSHFSVLPSSSSFTSSWLCRSAASQCNRGWKLDGDMLQLPRFPGCCDVSFTAHKLYVRGTYVQLIRKLQTGVGTYCTVDTYVHGCADLLKCIRTVQFGLYTSTQFVIRWRIFESFSHYLWKPFTTRFRIMCTCFCCGKVNIPLNKISSLF